MKYIIADPDEQCRTELKSILDGFNELVFQGGFPSLKSAEESILSAPPDIAFIRTGKAELNPFRLAGALREQNPFTKVVFISSQKEHAVDAFECEADGFVLIPFEEKKIRHMLNSFIARNWIQKETY